MNKRRTRLLSASGLVFLALILPFLTGCSTKPKTPPPITGEKGRARGFLSQGNKQFDAGLFDAADGSYKKALALYGGLNDDNGIVDSLLALARNETIRGNESQADRILGYAETYARMTGSPELIRAALNSRGEWLVRKGELEAALALCESSLTPGLPSGSEEAAGMYRLRGKVLNRLGRYEEAESSVKKALEIDTTLQLTGNTASDLYILASIYSQSGRYKEAEAMALKALENDRKIESMTGIAADLTALARISDKGGDPEKSLGYWHEAYMAWRGVGRETERKEAAGEIRRLSGNTELYLP